METKELETLLQKAKNEQTYDKQELLEEILKAEERIDNKNSIIKELTFERNLIFENLLDIINKKLRCSSFNIFSYYKPNTVENAWFWFNCKADFDKRLKERKISKDKYKDYKRCYEVVINTIKREFFGDLKDSVEILRISQLWTSGYEFMFSYKDQKIMLFIPLFKADKETWYDTLSGYKVYYNNDNSDIIFSVNWLCSSLDAEEVANKLQDFLLNERWKEK